AIHTLPLRDALPIYGYLNFDGKAEEAMRLYERVLGGKLTDIHRFGSMPPQEGFELTPKQENYVMHVALQLPDGQMLMASDIIARSEEHTSELQSREK